MTTTILTITVIIAGIAATLFAFKRAMKPRGGSVRQAGEHLGFSYAEKDNAILDKIKFFKMYDVTTRNASACNVLRSKQSHPDICVFDYEATTGSADAPVTDTHTVFYFNDDRMNLPGFRLVPENSEIARRNDSVLKYRPISFATHPVFSTRFRLVGPDDHEIRELFAPDLRAFFEKQSELCVEGFNAELLVYQLSKTAGGAGFHKSLATAQAVFQRFLDRSLALHASAAGGSG
jgi:hypothetical protein